MSITLLVTFLLVTLSCVQLVRYWRAPKRVREAVAKLPGPPEIAAPIIANLKTILLYKWAARNRFEDTILAYQEVSALCHLHRREGIFKYWLVNKPAIVVFSAELVESILSNPNQTTKSLIYFAFKPWLREGLVTSEGDKWHARRRIITPAFHFNILNEFVPAFDAAATKLIRKLNHTNYSASFDIGPLVASCTMDIICETAMGIDPDFLSNDDRKWGDMVNLITKLTVLRMQEPWLWMDRLFYASEVGKKYVECRDYMRQVSMRVILERRAEWLERMSKTDDGNSGAAWERFQSSRPSLPDLHSIPRKPRIKMAFLDLMLYHHLVEKQISIEDVQEEVDTFMFAGQDTTAVTISWTLYLLSLHQEVQDRVRSELDGIFAGQSDDLEEVYEPSKESRLNHRIKLMRIKPEAIAKMKYLEMVIKETLRLCPTVPNLSRRVTQDLLLGGKYFVPAGCNVSVHIHALHHDTRWFPEPDRFDPDRFLPENCNKRHPYAYVPFSAGPRNCVGQKFALMEAKVILAKILKNYRVVTEMPFDKLRIHGEVVLKTDTGLILRLEPARQ